MSYLSRLFAVILFLGTSLPVLRAAPGANVPWTTYEAENMTINGGTVIGPPTQVASLNAVVLNTIQMEASGGQAVALTGTGQYVEFTARSNANAIVVRYCVPDTADGTGTNSTISLYLNANFVQKLPVTSQYSWRYGAYPFSNNPNNGLPRNFFDEVRLIGLTINAGDRVRLEKDADDTATNDVIDLIDLEQVAPPLAAPSNSLCLTNSPYNADPTGVSDSTTALRNCITDARAQLKTVWMPAGTYVITGTVTNPSNTTLQGAGMWYTTLLGNASLYNTTPSRRITLIGSGNYIHLSDFAITGFLNYRNDSEPNDGLGGTYGIGSTISRIWVEHTKTGAWLVNSSGLVVSDCRFRNTEADGINLNSGMQATLVTNCTARGTGDDCFAIWPASTGSFSPGLNVITHCTGQVPFLANGGAIYGAVSNRIEDCAFRDMPYGCGILIAGTFPVGANVFAGMTVAQRCDLSRCGGYDPGWQWRGAVTLCPQFLNITNVNLNHLNITNSLSYAVQIVSPGSSSTVGVLSNATMNLINISTYGVQVPPYQASPYTNGVYGVWARSDAYGSLNIEGLTINGTSITTLPALGSALSNQSSGSPQHFAFNFLPVPTITSSASGNSLQLSWPAIYTGWTLQVQTNAPGAGIGLNWDNVSGSAAGNQISIPVDDTVGSVFFRLIDL